MSAVHVSPFVPGQELCGEAPCVPCEELGAGERQTNPDENREGERTRRRGGGRGGRLTTSVLWRSQWGRQPHQVRSMKQVCVLVFVSVGVRVCPRVCGLNYTFSFLPTSFGVLCCVFSSTCACMCTCVPYRPPSSQLACLCISYSATKTKWFSNHRIQPAEMFPHFCHPPLVSKNPAGINFPH